MMIELRPASKADIPHLERWDQQPHVIRATSDDPNADTAFEDADWSEELAAQDQYNQFFIAEIDGRPIGAIQMIDPRNEPTHYWGDIEPGLRALDIWIGEREMLGQGYGTQMMTTTINICFSHPDVTAIVIDPLASNHDAHRFYQRLGFQPVGRRIFGKDDCLVHRLERNDWKGPDA